MITIDSTKTNYEFCFRNCSSFRANKLFDKKLFPSTSRSILRENVFGFSLLQTLMRPGRVFTLESINSYCRMRESQPQFYYFSISFVPFCWYKLFTVYYRKNILSFLQGVTGLECPYNVSRCINSIRGLYENSKN